MSVGKKPLIRVGTELWAWALGRRRRVLVGGNSMLPTLESGWFVLFHPDASAIDGDVVVARHPGQPDVLIVKRLSAAGLVSDNRADGIDFAETDTVLGPVTLVLDQPRRTLSRR